MTRASLALALALFAPESKANPPEAPRFEADVEECAGWEPPHATTIHLEVSPPSRLYLDASAFVGEHGLERVTLSADALEDRPLLLHEIAHAWSSGPPLALTEGAASLLADCMADTMSLPWTPDDSASLQRSELATWTGESQAFEVVFENYPASQRLLRSAAVVLESQDLWPQDGHSFARLRESAARREATALIAFLDASPEKQRRLLADADRDGLPALGEALLDTSDATQDTDGDGVPEDSRWNLGIES